MKQQSASVNLRGDLVIMYPENITTQGVGVSGHPVIVVGKDDPKIIGENLLLTLQNSSQIVLHPEKWESKRFDYVLKAAKTKSLKEFMKGTRNLSVAIKENRYIFWPTKNGGSTGPSRGFHFLPEKETSISTSNPEELGRAVLAAFENCE